MPKPKVVFYWCTSCGGCDEAVIDLEEDLLKVADAVDIVLWPVALDFKRKHVEALQDGEIAVSFINGAIRLDDQEEMAKMLRRKSQLVVAFGACAHMGGIPALGNLYTREDILKRVYQDVPTLKNPQGLRPQVRTTFDGGEVTLPEFSETIKPLDQVIAVDYYLPGCPPSTALITGAVDAILKGGLPQKGEVLAPDVSLCETCARAEDRPDVVPLPAIKRPHEVMLSAWKCFLEQGIICLGPATRSGCGERCLKANMPCRGCMGPLKGVTDLGAEALKKIAAIYGLEKDGEIPSEEMDKLLDQIVDPQGTFYRFCLPPLPRAKNVIWNRRAECKK